MYRPLLCILALVAANTGFAQEENLADLPFPLWNVTPPLMDTDDPRATMEHPDGRLPIVMPPFDEHVRVDVPEVIPMATFEAIALRNNVLVLTSIEESLTVDTATWAAPIVAENVADALLNPRAATGLSVDARTRLGAHRAELETVPGLYIQDSAEDSEYVWLASNRGLYCLARSELLYHESYGVGGPLATNVTSVAIDSKGALWTGSPVGLGVRDADGTWRAIRGRDGLPVESVTAIAIDASDRIWIGTRNGLINYRPYETGRQWFYREGPRYLPNNVILDVALSEDGKSIFTATEGGLGQLQIKTTTLLERANTIETRLNQHHRRQGLVAAAHLSDPEDPDSWTISDDDNDGILDELEG